MEFSDLTTQFINTLALDVIQILDSRNYFHLAKVDAVPCMWAAALSPFRASSRQADSLAYIECITDAYSQLQKKKGWAWLFQFDMLLLLQPHEAEQLAKKST